jgi:hypothetical protein
MADATYKAFAGIRNTLPPERLAPEDLTEAVNVDIDDSGRVSRRAGTTLQVAGAAHSLWSDGEDCLYVAGSALKRLNADFSSTTLATGLLLDMPNNYVAVNGNIYWSNGQQSGALANGRSRSWGMTLPEPPGLLAIAGLLPAGAYQAVLTTLRADGQESGAGIASLITLPDNAGVRVSWPVPPDPAIVEVAVYLTEPDGKTLYQAAVVAASNGSVDITSYRTALPLATQWLDQPPAGQCLAVHRGRIIIAAGNVLFATAALGYEYCDRRDYIPLDGSSITFVAAVEHGLFVGTEQQVYFLAGDRLEDLALKVVVDGAGIARSAVAADGFAVSGNAGLAGQQCVLFATSEGICQGNPDGSLLHLTHERYRYLASATGAAHFRRSAVLNQYLLFLS